MKDSRTKLDKSFLFITAYGKRDGRSAAGAKLLRELGLNAIWFYGGTNKWLIINN